MTFEETVEKVKHYEKKSKESNTTDAKTRDVMRGQMFATLALAIATRESSPVIAKWDTNS